MKPLIAPSFLSADFGNLQRDVELINNTRADWCHLDIMDGNFVPNISFGIPVCAAINQYAIKPLDIHLMIREPHRYFQNFKEVGAYNITIHYEAYQDNPSVSLEEACRKIRAIGCHAGIAVSPETPVKVLQNYLSLIDLVCVMSVKPGFGGQVFIENTYEKIITLKAMIAEEGTQTLIEVDGGVNFENAGQLVEIGADVLVAGSFVFKSPEPSSVIARLKGIGVTQS